MRGDSGSDGHVGERAVAVVVIEPVGQRLVEARMAIGANAASGVAAEGLGRRVPLHVVDDEQIQAAVVVVVDPGRRHRPVAALEPGRRG